MEILYWIVFGLWISGAIFAVIHIKDHNPINLLPMWVAWSILIIIHLIIKMK